MHDTIENFLGTLGTQFQELIIQYHRTSRNQIRVRDSELEECLSETRAGVGIRVLTEGCWGFASFSGSSDSISNPANQLREGLRDATKIARVISNRKNHETQLAPSNPISGKFRVTTSALKSLSLEEMMELALDIDKSVRKSGDLIKSSGVLLGEFMENRAIFSLSGTRVNIQDVKSDLYVSAVAAQSGRLETYLDMLGITGTARDLFQRINPIEMAERVSNLAIKKLNARLPSAGMKVAVLDPEIVGLLCHEAIGHTVEADFVLSGSIAKDKIGEVVASPEITMADSGVDMKGAGWLPVDDEGTKASGTLLIEEGILQSYLHNRETAALMDAQLTGNARAAGYGQEPLIRMTNTYIHSGDWKREEIIAETKEGILLTGAGGGEADSNAEFVFEVAEAYPIINGEVHSNELLRGVAISGNAFETLKSVDAIGNNMELKMGAGACLKGGQPIKVDGGGPSLRCKLRVAGKNPTER